MTHATLAIPRATRDTPPMPSKWVPSTLGECLYWSYANLAMAHAAVATGARDYRRVHYMIRSRLLAGLESGAMTMGPLAEDEKLKLVLPQSCCYCGGKASLSVDHLLPRARGGSDEGENMVWACRSCNSSKGKKDVLVWLKESGRFAPLLLLRRYLKLALGDAIDRGCLLTKLEQAATLELAFSIEALPYQYPMPSELVLWVVPIE